MKNHWCRTRATHCGVRVIAVGMLLFASVFALCSVVTVRAASVTANNFADRANGACATSGTGDCTLREAVIYANANPGTTIQLLAGTYALTIGPSGSDDTTTGDLNIAADVTIVGAGASSTIIDASGMMPGRDRILSIASGINVALSATEITGGRFEATFDGGGAILNRGTLTLTDVMVRNNMTWWTGGGISNDRATLTLLNSVIAGNQSGNANTNTAPGGGIYNSGGQVTAIGTTIQDNTAVGNGSGLCNQSGGVMELRNSQVISNKAGVIASSGGGIENDDTSQITLSDSFISSNQATYLGGGVFTSGTAIITRTSIQSNSALTGGGVEITDGTVAVGSAVISGNISTFGGGGGVDISGVSNVSVTNTTISGNSAPARFGGAINSIGHTGTSVHIVSATLAGNTTGIYANLPGEVIIADTLLNNPGVNCSGPISSTDYNLSSDVSCTALTQPHDLTNTVPLLGPLSDNGGPTQTQPLLPGSPAIDAGGTSANGCPITDQRGVSRPQGAACDIGAFESYSPPPPAPRGSGVQPPPMPPNPIPPSRGGVGSTGSSGAPTPIPLPPSR